MPLGWSHPHTRAYVPYKPNFQDDNEDDDIWYDHDDNDDGCDDDDGDDENDDDFMIYIISAKIYPTETTRLKLIITPTKHQWFHVFAAMITSVIPVA